MDVSLRSAAPEDVPHVAAIFGRAFDDYRLGLNVTAEQLADFWSLSLAARVEQTTVAVLPDGRIAGFAVTVAPGAAEKYGGPSAVRKRVSLMLRTVGWDWFWRAPALFIPMGLAYSRRHARQNELYVSLIGVDPECQRRGIGRALLQAVEQEARSHNAAAILLHTASTNMRARAAYRRAGYELISTVRSPWSGPANITAYVALRKPLAQAPTPRLNAIDAT